MRSLEDYRGIVGDKIIADIHRKARRLYNKHILNINSTCLGGGVAEMLTSFTPLMNDIGVDTGWRLLHGNPDFFSITKKFHNALQGDPINLTDIKKKLYIQANENFSSYTHIDHDCVIIHDAQPLPLIRFYKKRQPWVWRCHVDLSAPNKELWRFLESFILRYDVVIISDESYRTALPIDQRVIHPTIDPLSPKNKDISGAVVSKYLKKFGIPMDKPLITQVSRFDKWKGQKGVLKAFEIVKQEVDCRLVFCGSMATDDPEGMAIYDQVREKAKRWIERGDVILITYDNDILVNALQRQSSVILQKSIREGFGLAVTEAMWKERPVVASKVGGIPLQITDGENGFLVGSDDVEKTAEKVLTILKNPDLARDMGKKGKEFVKGHFLITRTILDYLDLLGELLS
jgi:trehalose synthase